MNKTCCLSVCLSVVCLSPKNCFVNARASSHLPGSSVRPSGYRFVNARLIGSRDGRTPQPKQGRVVNASASSPSAHRDFVRLVARPIFVQNRLFALPLQPPEAGAAATLLAGSPRLGMSGDTTAMRATTGDDHDHHRAVRRSRQSRTPPAHLARSWLLRFLITSVVRWRRAGTG